MKEKYKMESEITGQQTVVILYLILAEHSSLKMCKLSQFSNCCIIYSKIEASPALSMIPDPGNVYCCPI